MALADLPLFTNRIDLVIFDCDGVLVDSEILSKRTILEMLRELGANVSEDYFYAHFLGYSFEHVTKKVLADYGLVLTDDFRLAYRAALQGVFSAELQTTVGLEDILSQLNVKSCVATSGSPQKVKHSLGVTGLDHFFKAEVFTSSEVKNGKPAPDLFLHAARQMGVKPENCLVIEDSTAGIKGAQAANMLVIRYAGASHLIHHVSPSGEQPHHNVDVPTISHWRQLFELIPAIRQG